MPCGPRARLTAYVAYQSLAFAEKDVLLAALADAGYGRAKAVQLAEQARRRYGASLKRTVAEDGSVTIRVRF